MYMVRQLTGALLQEIGRQFGGVHHTTGLHSINKIEVLRPSDTWLDRTIMRLANELKSECLGECDVPSTLH
jgi:chromosomal replication initiator protein